MAVTCERDKSKSVESGYVGKRAFKLLVTLLSKERRRVCLIYRSQKTCFCTWTRSKMRNKLCLLATGRFLINADSKELKRGHSLLFAIKYLFNKNLWCSTPLLTERTKKLSTDPEKQEEITITQSLTQYTITHCYCEWPCLTEHTLICPTTTWFGTGAPGGMVGEIKDPLHLLPVLPMLWLGSFSPVWANQPVAVGKWDLAKYQHASRQHLKHTCPFHNHWPKVSEGLFLSCYLVSGASFDEVFFEDVVQSRVQILPHILD